MTNPIKIEGKPGVDYSKLEDLMNSGMVCAKIGKEIVLKPKDDEISTHVLMDEDYFVNTWLLQFAINKVSIRGKELPKNYFDIESWYELTHQLTKGVIVVNQKTQSPVLVIPSFISYDITDEGQRYVDKFARESSGIINCHDNQEQNKILEYIRTNMETIYQIESKINPAKDITGLIPLKYYEDHGINLKMIKAVMYIRENFTYKNQPIFPGSEIYERVEKILKDHFDGKVVSQEDQNLILEITEDTFDFGQPVNKPIASNIENKQTPVEDDDDDGFAD